MSSVVTREQLIDILNYIGSPKIVNKEGKDDIQFCCTIQILLTILLKCDILMYIIHWRV